MSRAVGSIILILFGCGVLAVAWRGFLARELPAGSAGWRAYHPNRSDNPLAFHFFPALFLRWNGLGRGGILALFGAAPAFELGNKRGF